MRPAVALALAAILFPVTSEAAGPFDGRWSVTQVCETTSTGARGYTWRYPATVTDGRFVGQQGEKGKPGSMTLSGQIQADGKASFLADGYAADANYNIGFAKPGSPIRFALIARFEGAKGSGTRTEGRVCHFIFDKN